MRRQMPDGRYKFVGAYRARLSGVPIVQGYPTKGTRAPVRATGDSR